MQKFKVRCSAVLYKVTILGKYLYLEAFRESLGLRELGLCKEKLKKSCLGVPQFGCPDTFRHVTVQLLNLPSSTMTYQKVIFIFPCKSKKYLSVDCILALIYNYKWGNGRSTTFTKKQGRDNAKQGLEGPSQLLHQSIILTVLRASLFYYQTHRNGGTERQSFSPNPS